MAGVTAALAAPPNNSAVPADRPVSYEAFGAVGDGKSDDLPAIVEAHAFANAHGLPVKSKPGAHPTPYAFPRLVGHGLNNFGDSVEKGDHCGNRLLGNFIPFVFRGV